ncbi:MAG: polysaccharide pyruvyl transferase family protein [Coleofasciculaceae cyanobacterium]
MAVILDYIMLPNQQHLSTPAQIRDVLHSSLGKLGSFEECALLDYPQYPNIGDHFIWLATVFYLSDVLKTKINYTASLNDFSEESMEKQVGKAPIILQGGGNLGDLWSSHQEFREYIIAKYRDRPIIIMPQCIHFTESENLKKAADIFNHHPSLTIFTRDNYSDAIARKYFTNCQIIKAPDMVFHLVDMPLPDFKIKAKGSILYLCREDSELKQELSPNFIGIPNLLIQDWVAFNWIYRGVGKFGELKNWYWRIPGTVKLAREGWQRGLANPPEWISRQKWERNHPYAEHLETIYNPSMQRFSWNMIHAGIFQLLQHDLVITNRLHGHILCSILGIPHIFLPNAYHKNQSFYNTWSYQLPNCKFVQDAQQIQDNLQDMLAKSC